MASFQYKKTAGGNYADVPRSAYYGTREGAFELMVPEATDFDGNGRPCAAIGFPSIVIKSETMNACGMDFWQSIFAASTDTYVDLWVKMFNSRVNLWQAASGYLLRPKWSRCSVGTGSVNTYYFDVEITLSRVDVNATVT